MISIQRQLERLETKHSL